MPQIRQERRPETRNLESRPVFVDRTGRRRRMTVLTGVSIGVGLLVSLGLIVAGLLTGSPVPLPGWPDSVGQHQQDPADSNPPDPAPTSAAPAPTTSTATSPTPIAPASTAAPTTTAPRSTAPAPPSNSANPGQGDERRATEPPGRPSKSPGKPE
ncbi:MAG TPA: hypothetical protein VFX61_00505 [Micromonosporaceae bacterium]|nr:hypothetical protein [Micromonosporaceae bacterium]